MQSTRTSSDEVVRDSFALSLFYPISYIAYLYIRAIATTLFLFGRVCEFNVHCCVLTACLHYSARSMHATPQLLLHVSVSVVEICIPSTVNQFVLVSLSLPDPSSAWNLI